MDFLKAGLLAGGIGDIGLQLLDSYGYARPLHDYFQFQTPIVSVFKASLLTGFWSGVYPLLVSNPTQNFVAFGTYAGALDVLYRYNYNYLYPSLKGYYEGYSPPLTVAFNVGVAGIVWKTRQWIQG